MYASVCVDVCVRDVSMQSRCASLFSRQLFHLEFWSHFRLYIKYGRLVRNLWTSLPHCHWIFFICIVQFWHFFKCECLHSCLCCMFHQRLGEWEHLENISNISLSDSCASGLSKHLNKVSFFSFHCQHVHPVREQA